MMPTTAISRARVLVHGNVRTGMNDSDHDLLCQVGLHVHNERGLVAQGNDTSLEIMLGHDRR